jgi:hypothetical protein
MQIPKQTIKVPFEGLEITCPACLTKVEILVDVDVSPESVRKVNSEGYDKPSYQVTLNTNIVGVNISHQCRNGDPVTKRGE